MNVAVDAGVRYAELPLVDVHPNPGQPRTVFDEDRLTELAESITEYGVLQAILVTPDGDGTYTIVAGERRYRASVMAGLDTIPALVRPVSSSDTIAALVENMHREDLNPLEEAAAFASLMDSDGYTQAELATRLKVSRARVSHALGLLRLPADVQRRIASGVLSFGHARALCGVSDAQTCSRLAAKVVAEGLSVRSLEEIVALDGKGKSPAESPAGERSRGLSPVFVADYTDRLADALDTRVKITGTPSRGRIVVEYAGDEDLARLVDLVAGRRGR